MTATLRNLKFIIGLQWHCYQPFVIFRQHYGRNKEEDVTFTSIAYYVTISTTPTFMDDRIAVGHTSPTARHRTLMNNPQRPQSTYANHQFEMLCSPTRTVELFLRNQQLVTTLSNKQPSTLAYQTVFQVASRPRQPFIRWSKWECLSHMYLSHIYLSRI